jgi:hypothetical protein
MEPRARLELAFPDYKSGASPSMLTGLQSDSVDRTLERTEIIEISSLGWRPRAHPIYHARSLHTSCNAYSVVKDLL